jgi:hypothetical protein
VVLRPTMRSSQVGEAQTAGSSPPQNRAGECCSGRRETQRRSAERRELVRLDGQVFVIGEVLAAADAPGSFRRELNPEVAPAPMLRPTPA